MPGGTGKLATAASVTNETNARVSGDAANASALTAISARMPSGTGKVATEASVTNEKNARVSGDAANASQISTVQSQLASDIAAVNTKAETAISQSSANASQISTLATNLGNVSAAVQTKASASALDTLDGELSATWGVKTQVRADGRVIQTGVQMGAAKGADGTSRSEILMMADTIAFLNTPNGQLHTPFVFDVANDTAILNSAMIGDASITNAKITDAAIDHAKIADGAITSAKIKDAAITAAKIGDAQITNAKIGDAQVDTLKIAGNSVTIHGHSSAGGENYKSTHTLTCALNLAQPASLSVFVKFSLWSYKNQDPTYGLWINSTQMTSVKPFVRRIVVGYSGGDSGGPIYGSVIFDDFYLFRFDVGAGIQSVKLTGKGYLQHRALLVMASMR